MEMKVSGSGDAARGGSASSGSKKRPPSRLQKHAPASLQLEQGAAAGAGGAELGAWGEGRAAIPLLSPLVMSPTMPVWEADHNQSGRSGGEQQQQQQRGAARHGGGGERQAAHDASPRPPAPAPAAGVGWRHPALATPVGEPASLVSFFQSQCAVEVRNAQQ
ncbi:unnamed protein product [Urochloa humidicola]